MGVLNMFNRPVLPPRRLPFGTFTVDRDGRVVISTLPSTFPLALVREVGQHVTATFREAQKADIPLSELVIRYSSLKITARELRGGAIVFLSPQTPTAPTT